MLDIQFIREHADVVRESQRKRGESVELVDEVLRSDETRRASLKEFEAARAQQKEIGKKVAAAPADEKAALIAQTKELSQKVAEYKAAADAASEEYTTAMWKLSNSAFTPTHVLNEMMIMIVSPECDVDYANTTLLGTSSAEEARGQHVGGSASAGTAAIDADAATTLKRTLNGAILINKKVDDVMTKLDAVSEKTDYIQHNSSGIVEFLKMILQLLKKMQGLLSSGKKAN